jgi:Holliday junction resolvase RusA-like endonuclease
MFKLSIDNLIPISKLRHRSVITNGKYIAYTPKKTAQYEKIIRCHAIKEMGNRVPFDAAVVIVVIFCFSPPKSWSKKKKEEVISNHSFHVFKPDVDNLLKAVKDALTGIVYEDDKLVCQAIVSKQYSKIPGLHILVEEAEEMHYNKILEEIII